MSDPILSLKNGVTITQIEGEHAQVNGAQCWCGDRLLVAPPVMRPDHKKGDPVVCCMDHGHAAFRFKQLVAGKQIKTK